MAGDEVAEWQGARDGPTAELYFHNEVWVGYSTLRRPSQQADSPAPPPGRLAHAQAACAGVATWATATWLLTAAVCVAWRRYRPAVAEGALAIATVAVTAWTTAVQGAAGGSQPWGVPWWPAIMVPASAIVLMAARHPHRLAPLGHAIGQRAMALWRVTVRTADQAAARLERGEMRLALQARRLSGISRREVAGWMRGRWGVVRAETAWRADALVRAARRFGRLWSRPSDLLRAISSG